MLKIPHKGRIYSLVGFSSDVTPIAEELNIPINIKPSIISINLYTGFCKTNHAAELKTIFNDRFETLIKIGTIKKLIDSYQPGLNAGNYPFSIINDEFIPIN
jgi:hypothetical protein